MTRCWLLSLPILLAWLSPVRAVDLTKIERTIAKEPQYQSKSPKYCLLVFGSEAKTKVWIVFDGDEDVYVDRNGNGDLTEPGNHFWKPRTGDEIHIHAVADERGTDRAKKKIVLEFWRRNGGVRL